MSQELRFEGFEKTLDDYLLLEKMNKCLKSIDFLLKKVDSLEKIMKENALQKDLYEKSYHPEAKVCKI